MNTTSATDDFPGKSRLIDAVKNAISGDCPHAITDCLRETLCHLIDDQAIELPAEIFEPVSDHYARRELYHDPERGFTIMAMTWGPGQGTPIHDHSGMWCVEGVWQGMIEVTQYERTAAEADRCRFESVGAVRAGTGSAGSLIPPHEYHAIRNPSGREVAVSIHIYRGEMTQCSVFLPAGDGWYRRQNRRLHCDN